jgi:hypothetical protein
MAHDLVLGDLMTRRRLLGAVALGGLSLLANSARAQTVELPLPGGPDARRLTNAFPQKGTMILQRTRPPLLKTPWNVFDKGIFTPNDEFYVRWHWAVIPNSVNVGSFKLSVRGHVNQTLSLSLPDPSMAFRASSLRRSTSAPAIRAASLRHACPAGNGRMEPWAMPAGPAFGSKTCWIAPE